MRHTEQGKLAHGPIREIQLKRVFISYSRANLELVSQLIQDLQDVGTDTWHDHLLTGGQRWWDNILANIRECDIFIFLLSPESWESEACKSELGYAMQLGKTIVPVLVAEGINVNLLPPQLHDIQVTDYRERDRKATFALIRAIGTAPVSAPLPDPLPSSPRVPVSYLGDLKERIDSPGVLNAQEQIGLVFELEGGLRDGRSLTEIRDLLLSFRRRDDLLARVATRVDEALKSLEGTAPILGEQSGLKPPATTPVVGPETNAATHTRSKIRRYKCAPRDYSRLIADVRTWLDSQSFDTQQLDTETDGVLLQIKKRGAWRAFVGMATALNIVVRQSDNVLAVEIGAGKWIDKAAIGAVGMFVIAWPLAVAAGFGAWEQMKMPEKIFDYFGSRLAQVG